MRKVRALSPTAPNPPLFLGLFDGAGLKPVTKKNAFLYPEDPEAEVPRKTLNKIVDFRSESMPHSGYAVVCNRRKYETTENLPRVVVGVDNGGSIRAELAYERGQGSIDPLLDPEVVELQRLGGGGAVKAQTPKSERPLPMVPPSASRADRARADLGRKMTDTGRSRDRKVRATIKRNR